MGLLDKIETVLDNRPLATVLCYSHFDRIVKNLLQYLFLQGNDGLKYYGNVTLYNAKAKLGLGTVLDAFRARPEDQIELRNDSTFKLKRFFTLVNTLSRFEDG